MSTMRFADEIVDRKDIAEVPNRRTKPEAKELRLATQIVDSLESDWKPERYHDTFTEQLRDIIDRKDKGKDVVVEEDTGTDDGEVLDLMAALEASVSKAKAARSKSKSSSSKPRKKAS
jgi:DNA end-binding protein Ku